MGHELHRITFNPEQCQGTALHPNYRLRVKDVLDMLAAGVSHPQI
jgi:uncharacterized protein (DUF433 family)